jgi:hypothetical protein
MVKPFRTLGDLFRHVMELYPRAEWLATGAFNLPVIKCKTSGQARQLPDGRPIDCLAFGLA